MTTNVDRDDLVERARAGELTNAAIWSYWEGDSPAVIDLCLRTLRLHNDAFFCIGPDDVEALGGGEVLARTEGIARPFRSDLIRLWLIRNFGGVWVDADTVCVAPIDFLSEVAEWDLLGVWNPRQRRGFGAWGILATPFAARHESQVIELAWEKCGGLIDQMKTGVKVPYGMTSVGLMSEAWRGGRDSGQRVRRFEHWRYHRVPWYRARQVLLAKKNRGAHENSQAWNPNACLYHLTNVVVDAMKGMREAEILRDNRFASFLIQKGLHAFPGVPHRTCEILRRLPSSTPKVAEVGVFRGMNAKCLLSARRDVELWMVDPWGGVTNGYRATGDYQTRFSAQRWEQTYRDALKRTQFAENRRRVVRRRSVEAAELVDDRSIDVVFIDADHSYEAALSDIKAWAPKVRPGGWIGGHDYKHPREGRGYGVQRAVDEWATMRNVEVETGKDFTWFIRM